MKPSLWVLGGCFVSVLLLVLLAVAGVAVLHDISGAPKFPGGMPPTYNAANYDPRLTREASTATVVIAALNRYRSKHSAFPAAASQLAPYLPYATAASSSLRHGFVCGWYYEKTSNGRGYALSRSLGWVPCLRYEYHGSKGRWVFVPGDGTPEKPLILKP
jgi:hypothetical protein